MTYKKKWKFLRDVGGEIKSQSGNHTWEIGKWYSTGAVELCQQGFHSSDTILQALSFVRGEFLARVEVRGASDSGDDKHVHSDMRLLRVVRWTQGDSVALADFAAAHAKKSAETAASHAANYAAIYASNAAGHAAGYAASNASDAAIYASHAAGYAARAAGYAAGYAARAAGYAASDAASDAASYASDAAGYAAGYASDAAGYAAGYAASVAANKDINRWILYRLPSLEVV
jgi:hypothetical protein